MLRSMTGFGRCLVENPDNSQQWEIKSVNSRYLDLKWRLPAVCRFLEPRLEKIVRKYAIRGRVEISLSIQYTDENATGPHFDAVQANSMLNSLSELAKNRGDDFFPDYSVLLTVPSLWESANNEYDSEKSERMEAGLVLALQGWNESRASEGAALACDIQSRILRMEEWTTLLSARAPEIKDERCAALQERISTVLAENEQELDEARFLQEIVIYNDRLDVSEELTRLYTHLERLRQLLQDGTDAGRRLDFTLQECFREINTCGNKLPDAQLSRIIVDFKNELEKCREQVQNLE